MEVLLIPTSKMSYHNSVLLNESVDGLDLKGSDVYSTIDVNIQDVAESALMKQLKKHHAGYGCVAVMEVATGEIKAIANLQRVKDSTYYESYNFVVGAATQP